MTKTTPEERAELRQTWRIYRDLSAEEIDCLFNMLDALEAAESALVECHEELRQWRNGENYLTKARWAEIAKATGGYALELSGDDEA